MKRYNYILTLILVSFLTIFSFFHMFTIVQVSKEVIQIVFYNLLPSLLPFMILTSLCLNLGILDIFSFFIQKPFYDLFSLTPMMSSLYFVSFFCGYPTNIKLIKEAYELNYIDLDELQHLLHIASFSSLSFIFVSLNTPNSFLLFICHILPSLIFALFYRHKQCYISLNDAIQVIKKPHLSFVKAFKKSIISSIYAFIFILGYMLIFQFIGSFLEDLFSCHIIINIIKGMMEFSSGSLHMTDHLCWVAFFLSFGGFSVMMQADNLLEDIPYSFKKYFLARLLHGIFSYLLCFLLTYS